MFDETLATSLTQAYATQCAGVRDGFDPDDYRNASSLAIAAASTCGESLYSTREDVKVGVARSYQRIVWHHMNSGHNHEAAPGRRIAIH